MLFILPYINPIFSPVNFGSRMTMTLRQPGTIEKTLLDRARNDAPRNDGLFSADL
jgi:hypothetical protein